MREQGQERHVGVTVMPEFFQTEGVAAVLDKLQGQLGANVVTTSPYVAAPTRPGEGFREPPDDAGQGHARTLGRPLWGRSEIWMKTAPSFAPTIRRYSQTPYQPDPATELTHTDGGILNDIVSNARGRGMGCYIQIMAAIPPSYRVQTGEPLDQDQPMLPDGSPLPVRVDRNASLASANVRQYMDALIWDLCEAYPDATGIKFDWPEYPPYHFKSLLADYNPQVAPYAAEIGIDFERQRAQMATLCPSDMLRDGLKELVGPDTLIKQIKSADTPLARHLRLRHYLVRSYATFLTNSVRRHSGGRMRVYLQGFPPPWSELSGFDGPGLGAIADDIGIKFYTMHWPMIGRNYIDHAAQSLGLPKDIIHTWFARHFLGLTSHDATPSHFDYPAPDEPHPISESAIDEKVRAFGFPGVIGITHGYGPVADVVSRLVATSEATGNRFEINRYAYLGDAKIEAIANALNVFS